MKQSILNHVNNVLQHLYISPLEKCNLRCKMCYTKKTPSILKEKEIYLFISRYQKEIKLKVITFCGGEVLTLPYFPYLVNNLTKQSIFVQIITNGTIDVLNKFDNPNAINMIVSIDGPKNHHDTNRGKGMFTKSIEFLKKAKNLGFHTEVFTIVTKTNINDINSFEKYLAQLSIKSITFHPRKPLSYLLAHPVSNEIGVTKGLDFLDLKQIKNLMQTKQVFPPKNLGCYQISLMSDKNIYGCCEGFNKIGTIYTPIANLITTLKKSIDGPRLGCCQPHFMCGLKQYYYDRS